MADVYKRQGGTFGGGGASGTWGAPALKESAKTASTGTPASKAKPTPTVTTSFDVDRFRSSFKKGGLSSPTRFLCRLSGLPKSLTSKYNEVDVVRDLTIHTTKAQIPDMNFQSFDYSYFGIPFKYPHENMTSDLSVSVVCSADMWERQFFIDWQKSIIDYDLIEGNPTFLVEYQDEFVVDIEVDVYNEEGKLQKTFVYSRCWPLQVTAADVDWSAKDSVIELSVTFAHEYWGVKGSKGNSVTNALKGVTSKVNAIKNILK